MIVRKFVPWVFLLAWVTSASLPSKAAAETLYLSTENQNTIAAYDLAVQADLPTTVIGAGVLMNPRGLTIGPDGNLYVYHIGSEASPKKVLRFSQEGAFLGEFTPSLGANSFAEDMAFGPDGDLYVVDGGVYGTAYPPGVYRFDGTTGAAKGIFNSGVTLTQELFGLAFDATGRLYVSEGIGLFLTTAKVHRFNADGTFDETVLISANSKPADVIREPRGLVFDSNGLLYILDHGLSALIRYNPANDTATNVVSIRTSPQDGAFDSRGVLHVNLFSPTGVVPVSSADGTASVGTRYALNVVDSRWIEIGGTPLPPTTTSTLPPTTTTLERIITTTTMTAPTTSSSSTSITVSTTTLISDQCGDEQVQDPEECDEGEANSSASGTYCSGECLITSCAAPASRGAVPNASDALFILRVAVGLQPCDLRVCDVDGSCKVLANDALTALRAAVKLPATLQCPASLDLCI